MDEYKLKYPIKAVDGGEITVLKIKSRVKGVDLLEMDNAKGDIGKTLKLIMRMCGIAQREAEDMDVVDINALGDILVKKQEG